MTNTKQNKNLIIGAAALLLVVVGGSWAVMTRMNAVIEKQQQEAAATEDVAAGNLMIGQEFPSVTVTSEAGETIDLSDKIDGDHFVVINFHHPDCPCAENCGKLISDLFDQGYDEDVRIYGVLPVDTDNERVLAALEQQKNDGIVRYPVFKDVDQSATRTLGATRTPTVWVLDKDGRVAYYGAPESSLFPDTDGHRYLLKEAIDALREGETPEVQAYDPIGCLIEG